MASLKEVKNRIASVKNTRKITSAMKMVASSKLHHACAAIESMRPYASRLEQILLRFNNASEGSIENPFAVEKKEVKKVSIVLFTSNSSLCGAFNANVIRAFQKKVAHFREQGIEVEQVFPIGKKAAEAVKKMGFELKEDFSDMLDHPSYKKASALAIQLMELFSKDETDQIELIYHHFKSAGSQVLIEETYLPASESSVTESEADTAAPQTSSDFIIEPNAETVAAKLIPLSLHLKIYTALLDSLASEHAARVIAMQTATDNADDLLQQLNLTYNKTRQQAITTELLDIVGGSMH